MSLCDIVDEFGNKYSFTDTGTTKETDFTTSGVGSEEIDDWIEEEGGGGWERGRMSEQS